MNNPSSNTTLSRGTANMPLSVTTRSSGPNTITAKSNLSGCSKRMGKKSSQVFRTPGCFDQSVTSAILSSPDPRAFATFRLFPEEPMNTDGFFGFIVARPSIPRGPEHAVLRSVIEQTSLSLPDESGGPNYRVSFYS